MTIWTPNFSWITPHLAVGGSFPSQQAARLAGEHGIRAVVDLRSECRDDGALLQAHGIVLLHLPTRDMCGVSQRALDDGVSFACERLDRGERILVHCEHGIGRSATLALCVLVYRGQRPLEALERMKQRRALIAPSPAQFRCWLDWLKRHRTGRRVAWGLPDFRAFQAIAYRNFPKQ